LPYRYWWGYPYRTFPTNLREIDAGLDVAKVVRAVVEIGANAWLLNTAGIVSFYPSRLPFQRPSPWLRDRPSGDLIGDAVAEARAIPIAEHCLTFMLMFAHQLPTFTAWQVTGHWERPFIDELAVKTVGIIGLGNIGRELARKRGVGFGMRVVGIAGTPRPTEQVDRRLVGQGPPGSPRALG
jgi:hypothetical protein